MFINNAINLIDGIDGLAASLSILALSGFLYGYLSLQLYIYSILIAGLLGVLVAYFYFNVFGKTEHNRKIFMGDSGSLSLGFILGFLFVKYIMVTPAMPYSPEHLIFAYSLLIIPVFDVARVILHRLRHHRPLFQAYKNHIHHKLMCAGLSMHQSLTAIVTLTLLFLLVNTILYPYVHITWTILVDIVLYTLFHLLLNTYTARHKTV